MLLLGITDLHGGMILSTLRISSHSFALGFPKRPHTNGDVFPTYINLRSFSKLGQCGTPSQQSSTASTCRSVDY